MMYGLGFGECCVEEEGKKEGSIFVVGSFLFWCFLEHKRNTLESTY